MMKFEKESCLKVYSCTVGLKPYAINKMMVYDETGVICEGDFTYVTTGVNVNYPKVVELNIGEVSRKMKENFKTKDSYILKAKEHSCLFDVMYDLYVHKDTINLQEPCYEKHTDHIKIVRFGNDGIRFCNYDFSISRSYKKKYKELQLLGEELSKSWLNDGATEQLIAKINATFKEVTEEKAKMNTFTIKDYLEQING